MRKDILCGSMLFTIAAVFWMQHDYSGQITAAFPDFVLGVLALLGIGVMVRGGLRTERGPQPQQMDRRFLIAAISLMLLWALGISLIGFTISSALAFVVTAQLVRRGRPRPQPVLTDTAVGVVLAAGCFFVFTRVLLVPLPVSVLIGM